MTLSLPRKYRPKELTEIIGNKSLIESLETILSRDDGIPSSFLLYGPSGCGKTTLARIIAKELNANEKDIKQLNISNTRGIDAARSIIEMCKFKPLGGSKKVIVLNEVHKGTNEFFNAMLEILEEPPEQVHFILCTTEPEKLLKTIKTRCTEFRVSELTKNESKELLTRTLEGEGVFDFPDRAIKAIIKVAEGCPREILKILDTVIDIEDDETLIAAIEKHIVNEAEIKELCQALINKSGWKSVSAILKNLDEEPETIRRSVIGYMNATLLNTGNAKIALIMDCFTENYFNTGKAGLTLSCFYALNS